MNDDVTAVVTCFNYGRFLGEAVGSVLAQAGGEPKVVVVDDGSTDRATLAALDELPRGVEVIRQANAGVCAARNRGMARASTPYVLCLDADDRLAPGALARMRRGLEEKPGAGFAYGSMRFFGDWSAVWRLPPYDPLVLLDRHVIGLTALTRVDLVRDTGGYDPDFVHYEDWELWVHALARGWHGVRVDGVTLEYRRHVGSKFADDRRRYRATRKRLRAKHAGLYARRDELAARSALGPAGRLVHRAYWGPRPLPASLERTLQRVAFGGARPRRRPADGISRAAGDG